MVNMSITSYNIASPPSITFKVQSQLQYLLVKFLGAESSEEADKVSSHGTLKFTQKDCSHGSLKFY